MVQPATKGNQDLTVAGFATLRKVLEKDVIEVVIADEDTNVI